MSSSITARVAQFRKILDDACNNGYVVKDAQDQLTSAAPENSLDQAALEQAIRGAVQNVFSSKKGEKQRSVEKKASNNGNDEQSIFQNHREELNFYLDISLWAAAEKKADSSLPLDLFADLFAFETIQGCEELFIELQSRIDQLTMNKRSGLSLLRVCNSLLRRLSKSNNTAFCGEILLLLAYMFPLDERSGLNIKGGMHTDNVTLFGVEDSELNKEMKAPVDVTFYNTLWGLQQYFSNPKQFDESPQAAWSEFSAVFDPVVSAFETNVLSNESTFVEEKPFPKYLTNVRLMNLQINDPGFRQNILIQALILFKYLRSYVLDKMSATETTAMEEFASRANALLLSADGGFGSDILRAMDRESFWIKWKKDNCPKLKKEPADLSEPLEMPVEAVTAKPKDKKTREREEMMAMMGMAPVSEGGEKPGELQLMGTAALNRLWKDVANDDLEENRVRKMPMDDFLNIMLEEEKDADLTDAERVTNDSIYTWRALRMMSGEKWDLFRRSSEPSNLKSVANHLLGRKDQDTAKSDPAASPKTDPNASPSSEVMSSPTPLDVDPDELLKGELSEPSDSDNDESRKRSTPDMVDEDAAEEEEEEGAKKPATKKRKR